MPKAMSMAEVERFKGLVAVVTYPRTGRFDQPPAYLLTEPELDALLTSIRILHDERRELHDQLHRARAPHGREG